MTFFGQTNNKKKGLGKLNEAFRVLKAFCLANLNIITVKLLQPEKCCYWQLVRAGAVKQCHLRQAAVCLHFICNFHEFEKGLCYLFVVQQLCQ